MYFSIFISIFQSSLYVFSTPYYNSFSFVTLVLSTFCHDSVNFPLVEQKDHSVFKSQNAAFSLRIT